MNAMPNSPNSPSGRLWVRALASRCQQLAGQALDAHVTELAPLVRRIARDLPAQLSLGERLVVRSILSTTLARIVRFARIANCSDVAAVFHDWNVSDVASSDWQVDVDRFVSSCAASLSKPGAIVRQHLAFDARVAHLLEIVRTRYHDPRLTLTRVASESGLSSGHATRLLRRQAGGGFRILLQRTRMDEGTKLLRTTSLTVKEIAAAVGYASASQFCREFKRLAGNTPSFYRITSRLPHHVPHTPASSERNLQSID